MVAGKTDQATKDKHKYENCSCRRIQQGKPENTRQDQCVCNQISPHGEKTLADENGNHQIVKHRKGGRPAPVLEQGRYECGCNKQHEGQEDGSRELTLAVERICQE